MTKSKGHYMDCLELIERNSRHSEYVKNHADEIRTLIEEHFELLEKYESQEKKTGQNS